MISRRALLSAIASLPFLRRLKPKPLGPVICKEPPGGSEPVEIDYIYPGPGPSIQERVQRQALNIRVIDSESGRLRGEQRAGNSHL